LEINDFEDRWTHSELDRNGSGQEADPAAANLGR